MGKLKQLLNLFAFKWAFICILHHTQMTWGRNFVWFKDTKFNKLHKFLISQGSARAIFNFWQEWERGREGMKYNNEREKHSEDKNSMRQFWNLRFLTITTSLYSACHCKTAVNSTLVFVRFKFKMASNVTDLFYFINTNTTRQFKINHKTICENRAPIKKQRK